MSRDPFNMTLQDIVSQNTPMIPNEMDIPHLKKLIEKLDMMKEQAVNMIDHKEKQPPMKEKSPEGIIFHSTTEAIKPAP